MANRPTLQKGTRVVYYAEGAPYKGPFPALVEVVHPVEKDKKSEPPQLDLRVFFGQTDGPSHLKTVVPFTLEPKKHHWSYMPDEYKWPESPQSSEG